MRRRAVPTLVTSNIAEREAELRLANISGALRSGATPAEALASAVADSPGSGLLMADYVAHQVMVAHSPTQATEEDLALVSNTSERLLARYRPQPVKSLTALGQRLGLTVDDLCASLHIGKSTWIKLERRYIQFDTVPLLLIEHLADLLQELPERVSSFLAGSAALSRQLDYKNEDRPVAEKEPFLSAVSASVKIDKLSSEDAAYWTKV